jgi:flagellar basal body-associated protein FliL
VAERSSSLVSLLAALVVAVTGLIPVIWLLTSPSEEPVVEGEVAVEQSTTTSPEVTTVVVEPIPELEVDELDPSVVRVLHANGYAEIAGEPDLETELTEAISRVLIEREAVLTVVEADPVTEGG